MPKKLYSQKLDQILEENSQRMGPSLVNLILYGPSGQALNERVHRNSAISLTDNTLDLLHERKRQIDLEYNNVIYPKLKLLYNYFIFGQDRKVPLKFSPSTSKEIKAISLDLFEKEQLFILPEAEKELLSPTFLPSVSSDVKVSFLQSENVLVMFRYKSMTSIIEKYKQRFHEFNKTERSRLDPFICDVVEDPNEFWEEKNYLTYLRKYHALTRIMLNDLVGLTIVYLDRGEAETKLDAFERQGPELTLDGFTTVKHKFKNHRSNIHKGKPGGIHFTFVDNYLTNSPIEVKLMDIKSFIYQYHGNYSHDKYLRGGKKSNIYFRRN